MIIRLAEEASPPILRVATSFFCYGTFTLAGLTMGTNLVIFLSSF